MRKSVILFITILMSLFALNAYGQAGKYAKNAAKAFGKRPPILNNQSKWKTIKRGIGASTINAFDNGKQRKNKIKKTVVKPTLITPNAKKSESFFKQNNKGKGTATKKRTSKKK